MKVTDTSEGAFESSIVESLVTEAGYARGRSKAYLPKFGVDLQKLQAFLEATQPDTAAQLSFDPDSPAGQKFLNRLRSEVAKRGIIDVLMNPVKHQAHTIDLYYPTPSAKNDTAAEQHARNIFSVTRQLHFSINNAKQSLDLCVMINGLPVATFEIKNKLTHQSVKDAIEQYKTDRDPNVHIFKFGVCAVHFALDEREVMMCTHLTGQSSWFLPFNKGHNDGAGNPPNPYGFPVDYLWREILTKPRLTDILENYARKIEEVDKKTNKKKEVQIFPRWHQLSAVHQLVQDVHQKGIGQRYLIQHSAGSGKSNSITWLAIQLASLKKDGALMIDTVIIVTDRRVLDKQISKNVRKYLDMKNIFAHAEKSSELRKLIQEGKKIISTTVQKFPFVVEEIGSGHRQRNYAILIDEAHSSQSGRTASQMSMALTDKATIAISDAEPEDFEELLQAFVESKQLAINASYFAFTATPKNKTLEMFGVPCDNGEGGVGYRPFHTYTMKQAIQEGFIRDVLTNYTMYVDKPLSGVKAVQTLSRLNRAHPAKHDTFVYDFYNDAETIQQSFAPYYRTTILSEETDSNKLHDLQQELASLPIYSSDEVQAVAQSHLRGQSREQTIDPTIQQCVIRYDDTLDEDEQIRFKGSAKVFTRTYNFLVGILPYVNTEWEKLSIFLDYLIPDLKPPKEDDASKGILETIDTESYYAEIKATQDIALGDDDGELQPIPTSGEGGLQ